MIAFYATTFDALTMVISSYSYKRLEAGKEPGKRVRTFWAILFILLPIALIFSDNSINSLQSVAIIAAFPIGLIVLLIVGSFLKDASAYLSGDEPFEREEAIRDRELEKSLKEEEAISYSKTFKSKNM